MSNFLQELSPAERIYYQGDSHFGAIYERIPDTNQEMTFSQKKAASIADLRLKEASQISIVVPETICIGVTTARRPRTEKREYRNAGRKKMLPEDLAINEATRAEKRTSEQILNQQIRLFKADQSLKKKAADKKKLEEHKATQEHLLHLRNLRAKEAEPQNIDELPPYRLITSGIFAIEGKTGIAINNKSTIFYIKNGANVNDAIREHLMQRKIASKI
jgi:hypothetical protein